jgi:hypothetical protein
MRDTMTTPLQNAMADIRALREQHITLLESRTATLEDWAADHRRGHQTQATALRDEIRGLKGPATADRIPGIEETLTQLSRGVASLTRRLDELEATPGCVLPSWFPKQDWWTDHVKRFLRLEGAVAAKPAPAQTEIPWEALLKAGAGLRGSSAVSYLRALAALSWASQDSG